MATERSEQVAQLISLREQLRQFDARRDAAFAPILTAVKTWESQRLALQDAVHFSLAPLRATLKGSQEALTIIASHEQNIRESLDALTQPLREMSRLRATLVFPVFKMHESLQALNAALNVHRVLITSFEKSQFVVGTFAQASFRDYSELLSEGVVAVDGEKEPTVPEAKILGDEIALAGGVAVAAAGAEFAVVDERVSAVIVSLDEVLARGLPRLKNGLFEKWEGARQAVATRNPNRAAFVSLSLRELLKGVLNALVIPRQEEFEKWVANLPAKNRGMDAKAKFLLRGTILEASFAETDARLVHSLLDHVNREGVHADNPKHTDAELLAILRRVEGFVASLLEMGAR